MRAPIGIGEKVGRQVGATMARLVSLWPNRSATRLSQLVVLRARSRKTSRMSPLSPSMPRIRTLWLPGRMTISTLKRVMPAILQRARSRQVWEGPASTSPSIRVIAGCNRLTPASQRGTAWVRRRARRRSVPSAPYLCITRTVSFPKAIRLSPSVRSGMRRETSLGQTVRDFTMRT